jgi:hypothetical protein
LASLGTAAAAGADPDALAPLPAAGAEAGALAPLPAPSDDLADRHRRALFGEELGDRARRRGRQLHVDLVGGDLDDRVAVADDVADLDRPLQDGALGHRLAARGRHDVDDLAGRVIR